jgi:hypothetical protein
MLDPKRGRRAATLGVYCLESWGPRLTTKSSVRPLLELASEQTGLRFIHRVVDTDAQLVEYLDRWTEYPDYRFGYIACHGNEGELKIGSTWISLEKLASELEERNVDLAGKTVYFGSCAVLAAHGKKIETFRKRVGADVVCGYRGDDGVYWLESAGFELILLDYLTDPELRAKTIPPRLRMLRRDHPQLVNDLEFAFFPPS